MRLTLLTTILLAAPSLALAQPNDARPSAPRPGDRVTFRGYEPGPGKPRIVNASADWDDFVAFYTAIREHDWETTFELRLAGLLLELPAGSTAEVLDYAAPEWLDDPVPDAVQVRIVRGERKGETFWVPAYAVSVPLGVASQEK